MNKKNVGVLVAIGGLLIAGGSFLAWATDGVTSVMGVEAIDGWLTLIAGVALMGFGYLIYIDRSTLWWLPWPFLVLGAVVALMNFFDVMGLTGVDVGIGMWLIVVGLVIGLVGLLMERRGAAQPQPGAPMQPME